jgi:hypothetical protein
MAEARDFGHLPRSHVGAHGDDAGEDALGIGLVLDVAVEDMGKAVKEARSSCDEPQQAGNADPRQPTVEGAVRRLLGAGTDQCAAALLAGAGDLDVFVLAAADALIDRFELGIQGLAERCQGFLDRGREHRGADLAQHPLLVLPAGPLGFKELL